VSGELMSRNPDQILDVRGESCPVPEMEASKKLKKMKPGQILEVITDHQPAVDVTLPSLAKNLGYPFTVIKDGEVYRVRILKVK
jgi:TusA-related sulfurtransferase